MKAYVYLLDRTGMVIFRQDVTDDVINEVGSVEKFFDMRLSNPSQFEEIESVICERVADDWSYELSLDNVYIDMSYIDN